MRAGSSLACSQLRLLSVPSSQSGPQCQTFRTLLVVLLAMRGTGKHASVLWLLMHICSRECRHPSSTAPYLSAAQGAGYIGCILPCFCCYAFLRIFCQKSVQTSLDARVCFGAIWVHEASANASDSQAHCCTLLCPAGQARRKKNRRGP